MSRLLASLAILAASHLAAEEGEWFPYINIERGTVMRMSDSGISSHTFAEVADVCGPEDEFICYQLNDSDFGFSVPRIPSAHANHWEKNGKKFCVVDRFVDSGLSEATQLFVVILQRTDDSCGSGSLRVAGRFVFSYAHGLRYIDYSVGAGPLFHLVSLRPAGWGAAARSH